MRYNFQLSPAFYAFITEQWDIEYDDRPDIDLMMYYLGEGQ